MNVSIFYELTALGMINISGRTLNSKNHYMDYLLYYQKMN